MKDALGHGSNSHGGSMVDVNGRGIMPSRPFRAGTAHQVSIAERHGIPTDHLMHPAEIFAHAHAHEFGHGPGVKGRASSNEDGPGDPEMRLWHLPNWPNVDLH